MVTVCLFWVIGAEGLLAKLAPHAAKPALLINGPLPASLVLEGLDCLEDNLRRHRAHGDASACHPNPIGIALRRKDKPWRPRDGCAL